MSKSYPLIVDDLVTQQFDRRLLRYILDNCWPKQANTTIRRGPGNPRSFSPAAALLLYAGAALHQGGIDREGVRRHLSGLWVHHEALQQLVVRRPKTARGIIDRYGHARIVGLRRAVRSPLWDPRKATVTTNVDLSQLVAKLPVVTKRRAAVVRTKE